MTARHTRLGAALLAFAATALMAAGAWAQSTGRGDDFCSMIDAGDLIVTVRIDHNGAELYFMSPENELVQTQVHALAARSNSRYQDGFAPPPARGEWEMAVPPSIAIVLETMQGARLFLTDTSPMGSETIRAWAERVQTILSSGECTRLLEPAGEV